MRIVVVAPLLAVAAGAMALAQSPAAFSPTGNMTTPRAYHTATLLLNGKVLIAGGLVDPAIILSSAEVYDPETRTFSSTGDMTIPLLKPTATLLPNGQVLIVGLDADAPDYPLQAVIYDPHTGTFTPAGSVSNTIGDCALATPLTNGRVLVSAGVSWFQTSGSVLGAPAYLYDWTRATFSPTGTYVTTANLDDDECPTVVLLADGKVLTTWEGWKAEVYNPDTGTYFPTGDQDPAGGQWNTGTLLTNGNALIAGGTSFSTNALYNPITRAFTATGYMNTQREGHTATLLPDGTVFIAGGVAMFQWFPPRAELYEPDSGKFTATNDMMMARAFHTATLLPDGSVLIAGGRSQSHSPVASAEIYHSIKTRPAPALLSVAGGQPAILHAATQQIVSSNMPASAGEALEVYMSGLIDGSVIPPQVFIGGQTAEVLFFGNAPGFPGLNQVNVRVPSAIAPGPAVPVRLYYLGRPSNEVTIVVSRP